MNCGRQQLHHHSLLTGLDTGIGQDQVQPQGHVTLLILACLVHMICTQPMNGELAGMTWLIFVISCLSDQQAIMTWRAGARVLTGTLMRISQQRVRVVVTFYPGGNDNIVKHVMHMVLH